MAKAKAARRGRTSSKAAKRSTKKKAVKKAAKKAAKKTRPSRKTAPKRAKASKKQGKRVKRARQAKPVKRVKQVSKAPARKAAPAKKAVSPKKAPASAKAAAGKTGGKRKPLPRNAATARLNAAAEKKLPALNRERRRLAESDEELMPSAPSTLGYASGSSAARSGRGELRESLAQHTETGPALTGGDIDANWEDAYAVGDEAPGGDNPTPDQDRVDDIGKALGVQYEDNEELKGSEKIIERDRHRWELDPASSDDYHDRVKDED